MLQPRDRLMAGPVNIGFDKFNIIGIVRIYWTWKLREDIHNEILERNLKQKENLNIALISFFYSLELEL